MQITLRYGNDSQVTLDVADEALLGQCGLPRGEPVGDLHAMIAQALAEPLEYPALARCLTPGDRVVLALEEGVPRAGEVVAATIAYFAAGDVALDSITVLQPPAAAQAVNGSLERDWPAPWRERIAVATHDPSDESQFGYLAATQAGEGIFLNRALIDADVVLPVGCLRRTTAAGYHGIHGALFPAFSNRRAIGRFRAARSLCSRGKGKLPWLKEVDEVAWLLGVNFTLQIVPGGGDGVLGVLAGGVDAVRARGREVYADLWRSSLPGRAKLVVAGIEGAGQQTWQNLGRALAAAEPLVEDGGALVVCCDLRAAPGPAVTCLAQAESRPEALKWISRDRPPDTFVALQLARAQQRSRIYLLSGLEEELLEQLEIARVASAAEIARLVHRHATCIVVSNAPYVAARIGDA